MRRNSLVFLMSLGLLALPLGSMALAVKMFVQFQPGAGVQFDRR